MVFGPASDSKKNLDPQRKINSTFRKSLRQSGLRQQNCYGGSLYKQLSCVAVLAQAGSGDTRVDKNRHP
jgi:hypothetical protein